MKQRLQELREEFEQGQKQLSLLDQKRQELRDTLLRISGAIQVLEELLNDQQQRESDSETSGNPEAQISAVR